MAEQPLVSIGMPVFNCGHTLELAVRSILAQTYDNWELLLLDDGSTDNTISLARQFQDPRIGLLSDGRRYGLAARLNQAIDLSRGVYFARMDGDDISYPERLERQVNFLEAQGEVDLVGSAMMIFTEDGRVIGKRAGPKSHTAICPRPTTRFRVFHPTFLGRLAWFKSYYYDARAELSQDQDLLLRSYRQSCFANLAEILVGYREEKLVLRKILRSRKFFIQAMLRQLRREQKLYLAPLALVEEGLKAALDVVAIGSGLNYRILPQRAQRSSLQEEEIARWQQVWRLVTQPAVDGFWSTGVKA